MCPARAIVMSGLCVCVVVWIRERPQTVSMVIGDDGMEEGEGGTLRGLPELDTEVDVRQIHT